MKCFPRPRTALRRAVECAEALRSQTGGYVTPASLVIACLLGSEIFHESETAHCEVHVYVVLPTLCSCLPRSRKSVYSPK